MLKVESLQAPQISSLNIPLSNKKGEFNRANSGANNTRKSVFPKLDLR